MGGSSLFVNPCCLQARCLSASLLDRPPSAAPLALNTSQLGNPSPFSPHLISNRSYSYPFSVPGGPVLHPEDLLPGAAARSERTEEQPAPHPASTREPPHRSSLAARLEHLSLESCDYVTEAGVKFILGTTGSAHICSIKVSFGCRDRVQKIFIRILSTSR
jgi:hypothetical protein